MQPIEILKSARELISEPIHWTQDVEARNYKGVSIRVSSPGAVCFCAMGALKRVSNFRTYQLNIELTDVMLVLKDVIGDSNKSIMGFNDSHTHDEVIHLFDKAIEKLS